MRPRLGRSIRALVAVVAVTSLLACGGRQQTASPDQGAGATGCEITAEHRIGIATGNTGGVYYVLGGGFAEAVSAATGGKLKATAAETGASIQNIQQLVAGNYQVAFSLADTAADAVNGTGFFAGTPQPINALARLYPNFNQVVVRADVGITTLADLRGKRVSTGSPKSGTEVIANRMLQAAGLNPETDLAAQRLDIGASVDGMKDGTIDAMFFSGGLPTPNITDLFTSLGDKVRLLNTSAVLGALREINPVYDIATIPASTYPGAADTPTIVVPNLLIVPENLNAATACVLTKTLFERKADLVAINPAAKDITLQQARDTDPVPLHPGAKQALDTLGAP
ncbi:MAG: TAXI family TRAP transporter solute-binding subunit [Actinomycetota bacterium]|nr:TAXI family TRAP transporter solute-binding subunit [Actinomycetota bacterium]